MTLYELKLGDILILEKGRRLNYLRRDEKSVIFKDINNKLCRFNNNFELTPCKKMWRIGKRI